MEKDYLKSIETFLRNGSVMLPETTLMEPRFHKDSSIKAVFFDIYGTILISASGDIEEMDVSAFNLKKALDIAEIRIAVPVEKQQKLYLEILESFRQSIDDAHHTRFSKNNPFPEVSIPLIWENIISTQVRKGHLILQDDCCIRCFTFLFELLSNAVYPMPGMSEVIGALKDKGLPLGIISNAQFYTPVILNYYLNHIVLEAERIEPFEKELTIFSYEYMRSKPDPFLFEMARSESLKKFNIHAHEILYVGNDMFRDIYPAATTGFKTALFAGDKRSLRLRKEKPDLQIEPDYIITDLYQILKILP